MSFVVGRSRKAFLGACVLSIVAPLAAAAAAEELRCAISHRQEKLSVEGVANFGRMDDRLYRGAQPTPEGFAQLRGMGIDTVVRLSLGEEGGAAERAIVESLGMHFVNLPWSSVHDPNADQIVAFLKLVREHPDHRFFVHCKAGADRTGVFVALYRIVLDHWTPAQAIDEMKAFHYRYVFPPHLQAYVEGFPNRLTSEPAFVGLEAVSLD
jgi:protein tyrosine/serine phosphatase